MRTVYTLPKKLKLKPNSFCQCLDEELSYYYIYQVSAWEIDFAVNWPHPAPNNNNNTR